MSDDLRFKHLVSCLVAGPSGSGKSSFCFRFLRKHKALCTEPNFSGGNILRNCDRGAIPSRQLAGKKHVRFHEGVPADFNNCGENPCLIILYDLLNNACNKDVCELCKKCSHHRNISVILITQKLFHQRKFCCSISLNAMYNVVLENMCD